MLLTLVHSSWCARACQQRTNESEGVQHLHRQQIAAHSQQAGHVKLRSDAAVLAVTHKVAIHPARERRVHALKHQRQPLRLLRPELWDAEAVAIAPCGVLRWHEGRIDWPRVLEVGVNWLAKALHLPVARHCNLQTRTGISACAVVLLVVRRMCCKWVVMFR